MSEFFSLHEQNIRGLIVINKWNEAFNIAFFGAPGGTGGVVPRPFWLGRAGDLPDRLGTVGSQRGYDVVKKHMAFSVSRLSQTKNL